MGLQNMHDFSLMGDTEKVRGWGLLLLFFFFFFFSFFFSLFSSTCYGTWGFTECATYDTACFGIIDVIRVKSGIHEQR